MTHHRETRASESDGTDATTTPIDGPLTSGPEHEASASSAASPTADAPALRPRIRVGALLWGLVLVAVGATTLWIATSRDRRAATLDALVGLDPLGWSVIAVIVVGGIITLIALAAVLRRLQPSNRVPN
ncbi:hypothetical protein [Homoserinibacter sp. GY 40078]|uniref:hypothetical protein n=1 Tax=Homoserinibacter sp. GY 40078 TaxID=2603275 RepID=UPI0011C9A293|nr:hypothetical protein [Homoserinibacter sp. GY 40078]TXK18529.1 hypothetical protein FVQ89_00790 [Homoserinibacter sp. GY 40078]